jgi:hypothetical protein
MSLVFLSKERKIIMDFNDKVNGYFDWLKKSAVVEKLPDGCFSVATPFMDSHNDGLVVYVSQDGDQYKLSDDAYVISDLQTSGSDIDSVINKERIKRIARSYNVDVVNDELVMCADDGNFNVRLHLFIAAMVALSSAVNKVNGDE